MSNNYDAEQIQVLEGLEAVRKRPGIIRVNKNFYVITITSQSFIYGIIDNLINKMMQSSCRRTSYLHSRSFSDSLKSFQNLYLFSIIII